MNEACGFLADNGVQMGEIGCGGFPGKAHCDAAALLADAGRRKEFMDIIRRHGLEISALSSHGNMVHPDKAVAKRFDDDLTNLHEKERLLVTELYPGGLHGYIAGFLEGPDMAVRTATLDDPACGLTEDVLADTDVLVWWGHMAHDQVPDEVVDRVQRHILSGMGLVVLHSGHHSRILRRIWGPPAI